MATGPLGALMGTTPLSGAVSIVETSQKKLGEFKPKITASINIRRTLDEAGAEANRQRIIRSAVIRLDAIRQDLVTPQEEWETTAGFLMLTGQPFKLDVSARGEITVEAQVERELSEYPDTRKQIIRDSIAEMNKFFDVVELADRKTEFREKLLSASLTVLQLENLFPAKDQWEKDYLLYRDLGQPVRIQLDAEGELVAVNQLETDFSDVEKVEDRLKLLDAQQRLKNLISGVSTPTEAWEQTALGSHLGKDNYFLDLDANGEIVVKTNTTPLNLIPSFLEETEDDIPKTTEAWHDEAIALFRQKQPFHLDFDFGGNIVVKQNDFLTVAGINRVPNPLNADDPILAARLNLLA